MYYLTQFSHKTACYNHPMIFISLEANQMESNFQMIKDSEKLFSIRGAQLLLYVSMVPGGTSGCPS